MKNSFQLALRAGVFSLSLFVAPFAFAQSPITYTGTRQTITYAGELTRACPTVTTTPVSGTAPNGQLAIPTGVVGCPAVSFFGTITVTDPPTIRGTVSGGVFNPISPAASPLSAVFAGEARTIQPGNETHDFWVDIGIIEGLAPNAVCAGGFPNSMHTENGPFNTTINCPFPSLEVIRGTELMSGSRLVAFDARAVTHVVLDTGHAGQRCCANRGGKYEVKFTALYKFAVEGGEISPGSLSFSSTFNGPRPDPKDIVVRTFTATPATFTARVLGATANDPVPAWLSISTNSGSTTTVMQAIANQAGLQVGNYSGRVQFTVAGATLDMMVTLAVAAGNPALDVAPTRLRFGARSTAPGPLEQPLLISNKGGGAPIAFTASVVNRSSWIKSLTPSSGTATGDPTVVRVQVDSTGLGIGAYVDAIRIASASGNVTVPVTLVVNAAGALISLGEPGVYFPARLNQGSSQVNTIRVLNLGDPGTTVNWTARIFRGAGLLRLTPASGTSRVGVPSTLDASLADGATATAGAKYALVEVADPQAQNSPQYAVAVVDVTANTPAVPLLSESSTGFALRLDVSSAQPVAFTASSRSTGTTGVTVTPASGTVSSSAPVTLQLQRSGSGSPAPGVYYEPITVAIGGEVRNRFATFVVPPTAADAPNRNAAGCTPTGVAVIPSGMPNHFSVPAGWPASLIANLTDNCGDPIANGSVVATFSNGDPPLTLLGDQAGTYSASWQPVAAQAETAIRLTGTSGALTPSTFVISGAVNVNTTPPPVLAQGGIIHNLNPILGAPLSPGMVAQVYGDNFAPAGQSATAVPLPNAIGGTELIVGPTTSPLYYVSKGQLTVQLANELAANRTYSALVGANGTYTLPEPVDLIPVQPGTVQFADGKLVAQHTDFSLVTSANPAKPGELLIIYLVGMGATDPAVPSGTASPGDPLAFTKVKPEVTVAGQSAELFFWGLTPGGVGLYQINFKVPDGAQTGDLEVVITQSGVKANVTKLVVAR